MKTVKEAQLEARIAENRRGRALSSEQDAALLAEYLAEPKAGEPRATYRSLAAAYGVTPGTVARAVKRAAGAMLVVLALSVDGWGCAGAAAAGEPEPFGWCCEGLCGLTAADSDVFEQCICYGAEQPATEGRGECVEVMP